MGSLCHECLEKVTFFSKQTDSVTGNLTQMPTSEAFSAKPLAEMGHYHSHYFLSVYHKHAMSLVFSINQETETQGGMLAETVYSAKSPLASLSEFGKE